MKDHSEQKAEIDFRDLLRKPEKLFGYSYFYFLAVIVALGILYVVNLTTVGKNSVPPVAIADSSVLVQDIPLIMPSVLPPLNVMEAGVSTPAAIERGRDLYRANCVACHGDNGQGDGPSAATLNPKPRNYHSLGGWKNGAKVSQIYKTLQEGIAGSGMASYSYLPPADRFALSHFVRTFVPSPPADSPDDLQALESQYQVSKGENRPGQIPIRKAERIIVAESRPGIQLVDALVKRVNQDSQNKGAQILRAVASDESRAIVTLVIRGPQYKGSDDFVSAVSAQPLLFGLKPQVNELSADEWSALYEYVRLLKTPV